MNSQYFKNYLNLKEDSKRAYDSFLQSIQKSFSELKQNHNNQTCVKFESELKTFKDFKIIKNKDKQDIYRYFVERNVTSFNFLRNNQQTQMRILKLTKTPLENYELNWKEVWERLLRNQPEPSAIKLYSQLIDFLKNIRHLYSPNNAVEVIDYFTSRHSLYNENLFLFISLFTNLTNKTSSQVFKDYFVRLIELYQINQLKAVNLLVMFINSAKYKNSQIPEQIYSELNNIIIYSLTTPNPDKKDSIEPRFNTQTSTIIVKMLGKCNKNAVTLLQQVLQIIKNFIRPFEDSKKPLKFLYQILAGLAKRIHSQQACRTKIAKLKAKQQKKQRIAAKKLNQAQQQAEQSGITQAEKPSQISQNAKPEQKAQQNKEDQQESSQEQSNENDSDQDQQAGKLQKMVEMELDIQQSPAQKINSTQSKIQRLQSILQNQLTPQTLTCVKEYISDQFQSIFYVNSKKIVNKLLKQIFILFPEFVKRSFQALQKAGSIPQINEQGLISNIKHIAKYIFIKDIRKQPQLLDNVMRIINRVKETRRITDVWQVFNISTQRIPLLDQKDMQKISESDKASFYQKFGQSHDRFYENYSQEIFECLKRVFTESQHYDISKRMQMQTYLKSLLRNSHPFYKKRVLKQIEQQMIQNNNTFLLLLFESEIKPSKQFEEQLRQLIDNRNIDNEQNLKLDSDVNLILSSHQDIKVIKGLIRKYSKKNSYSYLHGIMSTLRDFSLVYQPFKSTLGHFQKKPIINLMQEPSFAYRSEKLKNVYDYSLQIIAELLDQLKQFSSNPLNDEEYHTIAHKLFDSNSVIDFKNTKVQKRKTINELLTILKAIVPILVHQIQEYDPVNNNLVLRQTPYKRQSLLNNPDFITIVKNITYNQVFLHDHSIMYNLSELLDFEVFIMYQDSISAQKQQIRICTSRNQRQQLPGESNLANVNQLFIAKARLAHFSILYNKYRQTVPVENILKELRILLIAPGNDSYDLINKILVKKANNLQTQAENIILLLKNNLQSRFYYDRVLRLLLELHTAGYSYTAEQIIQVIDLHVPLIQSQVMKIRQYSLKSFQRFLKNVSKDNMIGTVQRALRKYINRQKLEIIWIIAIMIILKQPIRDTNLDLYLQDVSEYMKELQKLVVSQTRIIRRISIFAYSYCIRKAKKAIKRYEEVPVQHENYGNTKTIYQIFENGYIREQHKNLRNISSKSMVKKMQPYTTITLKVKIQHPIFAKIQKDAFEFILSNQQLGNAILKQFHIDMAGSVEQLMSMMQNKKHDLADIAMKLLQGCYMYSKLKKLNFDRIQFYFGERFFRYLFDKDAKFNDFKVFYRTKGYIEQHLANLEPYDNQTLVFIYIIDIFSVYQKNYRTLKPEIREEIEKFLLKIIGEVIYKGSGILFKKLLVVFSKIIDINSLGFVINYLQNLLKNSEKIARVTQALFTIYEDNYVKFNQITSFMLNEKLQINNPYINILITSIIALPQKYIINDKMNERFGLLNVQKQLEQKRIQRYKDKHYLLSTNSFNSTLIENLRRYLQQALQIDGQVEKTQQNTHIVKTKNELIKSTYSIVTNAISSYIQFYETQETVTTIISLCQILFKVFQSKMDHFIDFKQFQQSLKSLFSNKYQKISRFQTIATYIINNIQKIPLKKQADVIKIMANRPGNFLYVSKQKYMEIIVKMIKLEQNSMFYKDLLIGISTLLAYAPLTESEIQALSSTLPKNQALLLLQAHILSNTQIGSKFVQKILRQSGKDRRNIFCKEILVIRAKKQYLDDEQKYKQWKQIKQYSNPYHYHA